MKTGASKERAQRYNLTSAHAKFVLQRVVWLKREILVSLIAAIDVNKNSTKSANKTFVVAPYL